ncbi:MAG: type II toxin-antitoxin system VapC family toxin [Acidimicrobiia bacterium]|nr:type II toxin-antitoxin system VapC family toxin [Acidimicrobiia bacterium]
MRLLLDTQILLWAASTPERLGSGAGILEDTANRILISAASAWEIAIKHSIGRLPLPESPDRYLPELMRRLGAEPIAVEQAHALAVAALPLHHGDPFDRLLIAQAQLLDLTLVTSDRVFGEYEVDVLPCWGR